MPRHPLERLRRIALALPGAWEKLSHGEPTFWVGRKMFATFADGANHHGAGRHAVWCKAAPITQEILIAQSPARYFRHFGATEAATRWGLAEGRVGGPAGYQTYILLANPGLDAAQVTALFLRTDGTVVTKAVTVPPRTRVNVSVGPGTAVPELVNEEFGAVITADQPIVVERAMYSNANGVVWAAGTAAGGSRLP